MWMHRLAQLSVVGTLLIGAAALGMAQTPNLGTTRMLDCGGLPCVEISVGSGRQIKMLVDTGNVNSVLDRATAAELGLKVTPVMGEDHKPLADYGQTKLPSIRVGEESLGDLNVLVMDLRKEAKAGHVPESDGTLAYTAFKGRMLQLDYRQREVRVSAPLTYQPECPSFCGTLSTPTFGANGPPIVAATGFSINGEKVTAQIDTLYSGTMLIYPPAVGKLGLEEQSNSGKTRMFGYTDDGVEMKEGQSKEEGFGDRVLLKNAPVYFATPAVHLPDGHFDATVGDELLRGSVLSLDFRYMRVWLEAGS